MSLCVSLTPSKKPFLNCFFLFNNFFSFSQLFFSFFPEMSEQERFMREDICLVVDETDHIVGTANKLKAHEEGLLHRAFSVLLFDSSNGKMLIQKRSKTKFTFPLLWSNTCCSHPLDCVKERDEVDNIGLFICLLFFMFSFCLLFLKQV